MALNIESEKSYEQHKIKNYNFEHNWVAKGGATVGAQNKDVSSFGSEFSSRAIGDWRLSHE